MPVCVCGAPESILEPSIRQMFLTLGAYSWVVPHAAVTVAALLGMVLAAVVVVFDSMMLVSAVVMSPRVFAASLVTASVLVPLAKVVVLTVVVVAMV